VDFASSQTFVTPARPLTTPGQNAFAALLGWSTAFAPMLARAWAPVREATMSGRLGWCRSSYPSWASRSTWNSLRSTRPDVTGPTASLGMTVRSSPRPVVRNVSRSRPGPVRIDVVTLPSGYSTRSTRSPVTSVTV
jgi:hypothetical protein